MQVQTTKQADNKCEIHVVMDKNDVDLEINTVAKLIRPQVQVKGFRKGQAPMHLVKSQYQKYIREPRKL